MYILEILWFIFQIADWMIRLNIISICGCHHYFSKTSSQSLRGRSVSRLVTVQHLKEPKHLSGDGGLVTHSHQNHRRDGCSQLQPWPCWIVLPNPDCFSVIWREGRDYQIVLKPLDFSFLVNEPDANRAQPLILTSRHLGLSSLLLLQTSHGSPVGTVSVHGDGVRCHPHGCGSGEPQSVHLWAHHPAHVSGAALQLHIHAQHTEQLRPANCRSCHGGTVHCWHVKDVKSLVHASVYVSDFEG